MEPMLSFHHAALKIKWSRKHLDELNARCKAFLDSNPQAASFEDHPNTSGKSLSLGMTQEIPEEIPLLMGDVVANMRSSLDFAWMGLIRAANPKSAAKRTLPIGDNRKGLIRTIEQAPIGGAVKEAEALLADRIKSHRDIAEGGNKPLAALNALCNWNKHNLLIANIARSEIRGVGFGPNINIGSIVVEGHIRSAVLVRGSSGNFRHDGKVTAEIVFGKHEFVEREPVIPTLINMHHATVEALKAFCEVFPHEDNPSFFTIRDQN